MSAQAQSRNELCRCGSGKRYKNCHGALGSQSKLTETMERALAAQVRGDLPEAAALYDEALAINPAQPDALHMRGVVALSSGEPQLACTYIERARAAGLDTPALRYNLFLAHEAIDDLHNEMEMKPYRIAAVSQAAALEHQEGDEWISPDDVQVLAFFLPQFHRVRENDEWWGLGFTEWTNVRKAIPNFAGHEQPKVPSDLGYYDLLDPEVRERQAALAKEHGITGFCYYYYWFEGRRLLEQPLNEVIRSGKPDFPFCVFWANENWKRTWDGGNQEILMQQRHSPADDRAFIEELLPVFKDPRYIRVLGQPLLMIYRVEQFPNAGRTFDLWREICIANGEMPPFIVKADSTMSGSPIDYGADASLEFPPHRLKPHLVKADPPDVRDGWTGTALDMRSIAAYLACKPETQYLHFRTVVPRWDNTARRQHDGTVFVDATPGVFRAWLRETIVRAKTTLPPGQRLVFVNAWNEWAEGATLEPDATHGRGFLEAARDARYVPRGFKRFADVAERLRAADATKPRS